MNFLTELKKNSIIENSKGGNYYSTSYDANLDLFAGISRYNETDEIIRKFKKALYENEILSLANLLYILDIREGKGERYLFKTMYKYLCQNNKTLALKILPFIGSLGRWDYILVGIDTLIDKEVVELIKETLKNDMISESPSLLAKWLPTHRTHNKTNELAKKLIKKLNITEKEYRKILTNIRKKINLIENNLTKKDYETINFEEVPTKAMLKYEKAFERKCKEKYDMYLQSVAENKAKINTTGLYSYEIVNKITKQLPINENLYNNMWENQKDILKGIERNILVMADTSGSMTSYNNIPYATSVGLAIYIAERNNGIFKNHFISFSENPQLQEVIGNTIVDKVNNIKTIMGSTNIDKAFKLILDTATNNKIPQEEFPSHIIIISDMEFDNGVYSSNGTNFEGWKNAFKEQGYNLPKIIFWNVAGDIMGLPVTKFDQDVIMITGFSTSVLENLLNLEEYTPLKAMMLKLQKYVDMLGENKK